MEGKVEAFSPSGSRPGTRASSLAMFDAFHRSGSARMRSTVMVRAPASLRRVMMSARRVRGQGHWPNSAREASSMSRMRTGKVSSMGRGALISKLSKMARRMRATGVGSKMRSRTAAARTTPISTTYNGWRRPTITPPYPANIVALSLMPPPVARLSTVRVRLTWNVTQGCHVLLASANGGWPE